MSTRRLKANGVEIAFDDRGEGGRPFVLVHGYTGFRQDFEGQLDGLAGLGRTLAPDLRGHGESTCTGDPASYTLDILAQDLIAWLDALGLEQIDLLGHSMGGMIALRMALAQPERIASLVFMSTSAAPMEFVDLELLAKAEAVARQGGMATLFQIMRARADQDPHRGEPDRRVEQEWGAERFWDWRRRRIEAMDVEAYAALGPALCEPVSLEPRLSEIACPSLVLVGSHDGDFLAPSEALARGLPDADHVVLEGAGHQPQNETPGPWLDAITAHLERARRGGDSARRA